MRRIFKELKQKLKAGDTAIVYLPGHYGTIVDYNAKKDKYLLMDPHYLPKQWHFFLWRLGQPEKT